MKSDNIILRTMQKLFVVLLTVMLSLSTFNAGKFIVSQAEDSESPSKEVLDFDEVSVHDPSIIKDGDTYYVFGSHVTAAKSSDLKNWTNFVTGGITDNSLLGNIRDNFSEVFEWAGNKDVEFIDQLGVWAPDVYYSQDYVNEDGTTGAYLMYFSLSTGQDVPGVEHYRSLIGLAVSKDIEGPYVYQKPVIYSGFTNIEEDKGHWENTDFNDLYPEATPRSGYFRSNGAFHFDNFPNAIDPTIVDGHDGKVYMTYGSWNGGIWILEIDPTTGMVTNRSESYNNGTIDGQTRADAYFGTQIAGGQRTTGEGPYIEYHEASGYYHLYITHGTLDVNGSYNMRFFRSKNITGPYLDQAGVDPFVVSRDARPDIHGKILGSFEFNQSQTLDKDAGHFGYRVPGHNSVYYDSETGLNYLVFHSRFKDKGEGHEVRVHQILFDEAGWPLVAPQRYHGETIQTDIDVSGNYLLINQGKDTTNTSKMSIGVTLESDGTITGNQTGSWTFDGNMLSITLDETTFTGYVLDQSTPLTNWRKDLTITLSDHKGISLIGARIGQMSNGDILDLAFDTLDVNPKRQVMSDLHLPVVGRGGVDIVWESSQPDVISTTGVVTRQDDAVEVTLTATLTYAGLTQTKSFELETASLIVLDHYALDFEGNLKDSHAQRDEGIIVGANLFDFEHGNEMYQEGYVYNEDGIPGQAFYFDGETGIRLPDNLINSNEYTVSYWINAEQITDYTPTFFGEGGGNGWQNVILKHGGNPRSFVWTHLIPDGWYDAFLAPEATVLPINTWIHLAFTVENGTIKTYVDGVLNFEGENYFDLYSNASNNIFGLGVAHVDIPFKGLMDDFKVYPNNVLSEDDIAGYVENVRYAHSPEVIANTIFDSITIPETVTDNIELKTIGALDTEITWESSDSAVITETGLVKRPAAGEDDVVVTLKATVSINGESFTRSFTTTVVAIPTPINYLHYEFEDNLNEKTNDEFNANVIGDKIGVAGGNENYRPGIIGNAFYFDGTTGVSLPDDMIIGNQFTISYWMNPEELTQFSSAFFGLKSDPAEKWVNIMPRRWDDGAHLMWVANGQDVRYFIDTFETVPLNAWTYVTVTVDGNEAKLFENGELKAAISDMPDVFIGPEIGKFALGVNLWDIPFKGLIDELIVYPQEAQSEAAIKAYYEDIMSAFTPEAIAEQIFASINLPKTAIEDIDLPGNVNDVNITWKSSNPHIIDNTGQLTRPNPGMPDVDVRLSATVTIEGETFSRDYLVRVIALPSQDAGVHYPFEGTLIPINKPELQGSAIGNIVGSTGGKVSYRQGISGQAVYLDGESGIALPDNLITGSRYSVSMWINPEVVTNFTPTFFGASATDSWVSLLMGGHDPHNSAMIWSGEAWYDGISNKLIPANAWTHLAFTVNDGTVILYLDGQQVHRGTGFPDVFSVEDAINKFALGVNYWDTPFKGMMDELIIMPEDVLSATDINKHRSEVLSQLTPEKLAEQFFSALVFGDNGVVSEDLNFPTLGDRGAVITWKSSNEKYLTNQGVVTRPTAQEGDKNVRLTVTFTLDGETFTKSFNLVIKAQTMAVKEVHYSFDGHLDDASEVAALRGITTRDQINVLGGTARFRDGKVNQALYLDGSYGVRLPDGLIKGNTYSVSMWLKPETLTDFSTAFFGAENLDSWISFTPQGVGSQAALWSGTEWYDGLTSYVMAPNMWTHVAFTVDNGKVHVYINGEIKHVGTTFPNIFSGETDAVFGLGVNYWDTPFKGIVDELQVYTDRTMSAKDILAYYDATVGDDRFVRDVNKSLKLSFENTIGPSHVTGNRLDNYGGSVSYREGVIGQALYLDGNSGIRLQDGFLTSHRYSMQMWVHPDTITPYSPMFFGGAANSSWVSLPASGVDGRTMFWSGENWYDAMTSKTIPANRWSHLAVTVNNGAVNVYIDGELEYSGTGFPDIFNTPNTFAGLGVNFWDTPYEGLIDEFELHNNVVLSGQSIKNYYEETAPDQEEFERNQEKTHIFSFENDLVDSMHEDLEGSVVGAMIPDEGGDIGFVEGVSGQAAYFDGASGILLPNELITSENYSVSLWINPEEITTHTTTFFGAQNASSWVSVVVESGEFTNGNSMVWSGVDWFDGDLGRQIEAETWSHIAFTVNEGTLSAYLNGEKVFEQDGFPDIFVMEDSVFALGVNYWDTAFKGMLDEVMIFDSRVLTDEEVQAISEGEFDLDAAPDTDVDEVDEVDVETSSTIPMGVVIGGGAAALAGVGYALYYFLKRRKI